MLLNSLRGCPWEARFPSCLSPSTSSNKGLPDIGVAKGCRTTYCRRDTHQGVCASTGHRQSNRDRTIRTLHRGTETGYLTDLEHHHHDDQTADLPSDASSIMIWFESLIVLLLALERHALSKRKTKKKKTRHLSNQIRQQTHWTSRTPMWFRALLRTLGGGVGWPVPGKPWSLRAWEGLERDGLATIWLGCRRTFSPHAKGTTIEIAIPDASALPDALRERNSCIVDWLLSVLMLLSFHFPTMELSAHNGFMSQF